MSVKDAVAQRFRELCTERGIRPNELAVRAGVTPSTVYSLLEGDALHSVQSAGPPAERCVRCHGEKAL